MIISQKNSEMTFRIIILWRTSEKGIGSMSKFNEWVMMNFIVLDRKMITYPDGDRSVEGRDHISLYLGIAETSSLQSSWEVNATFSFLIFDQIHGKYHIMKGIYIYSVRRFLPFKLNMNNNMQQFISQYKSWMGFLKMKHSERPLRVNDICIFGIDVYVIENHGVGEWMYVLVELMRSILISTNGRFLNVF